jgi:glycosyltransferase involved in cell wall biosynthesis
VLKPEAYFELSPLVEDHWTGIPVVTAGLAEQAMEDPSIDWIFFYHSLAVPQAFVATLLQNRTGAGSHEFLLQHVWDKHDIPFERARSARAFFPNIKSVRDLFREEAIFVHDLSPLLTPQFHTGPTISHFADRFRYDVDTSVRFFCNSRATRDDLVAYFGIDPSATSVLPMGAKIDLADVSAAQLAASRYSVEPYVVVLGTLEPRKNGSLVLQYLVRNPGFASRFRIVFVGREGWLNENIQLLDQIKGTGLPSNRIVFTGYVDETEKIGLLLNASFCIYPSFFEGYGLPILEAALLGKIIVISNSSSMPEVAPEQSFFFDPADVFQFSRAIALAEKRALQLRTPTSLIEIAGRLNEASWERGYRKLAEWIQKPFDINRRMSE